MADPMKMFTHGGGVAQAARELGRSVSEILDFSASINPLGIPPAVRQAAMQALDEAVHYPEIDGASLARAAARKHGLDPAHILPGNGSTELLYLFPRVLRPRRALLVVPAFSEYQRSLGQVGTRIDIFALEARERFRLDPMRLLNALHPDTDLVLLANPANPTGAVVSPADIELIARAIREQALLAVDEAFIDFCPEHSVIRRVAGHDNIYVFRSLTKFFAMPGLRAGYLAGPRAGIARLAGAMLPWPLSTPSLAAALACFEEDEFCAQTLRQVPELRAGLASGLEALGMEVFAGAANYLLAHLGPEMPSAARLAAALRCRGLLLRVCNDFEALDERFLRVAVRTAEQNRILIEALAEVLAEAEQSAAEV